MQEDQRINVLSTPDAANAKARTETTQEEIEAYWWDKRCEALYRSQLSVMYHRKRERFLDTLDRLTKTAIMVSGGTAVVVASTPQATWLAASIAVLSALSLAFDYASKSRTHADLARRFGEIESKVESLTIDDTTETNIRAASAELIRTELDDPPTIRGLVEICEHELKTAMGNKKASPSLWQRTLAHFV